MRRLLPTPPVFGGNGTARVRSASVSLRFYRVARVRSAPGPPPAVVSPWEERTRTRTGRGPDAGRTIEFKETDADAGSAVSPGGRTAEGTSGTRPFLRILSCETRPGRGFKSPTPSALLVLLLRRGCRAREP
eukprot:gene12510-biopygen19961